MLIVLSATDTFSRSSKKYLIRFDFGRVCFADYCIFVDVTGDADELSECGRIENPLHDRLHHHV